MSAQSQQTIPTDLYPPGFAEWLQPLWEARQRFLADWTPEEKRLCLALIRGFTELGRGPSLAEVVAMSGLEEAEATSILHRFNKRDALKYDAEAQRIVAFYPFSDIPCVHQVSFPSGRRLFGM